MAHFLNDILSPAWEVGMLRAAGLSISPGTATQYYKSGQLRARN